MTSIKYEDIFSLFLGEIEDPKLASLKQSQAYELMTEYLHKAIGEPYVRRLFSSLTLNDELLKLDFELKYETADSSDEDFVTKILYKGMLVEWLTPQVRSKLNIAQMMTSNKESKFYSQAQHLSELRGMLEDTKTELRQIISEHGFIYNAYLDESS